MAAARGSLLKCDLSMLAEFGGTIELNRHRAHSLLKRMKFVQRKATTFKSKHTANNFTQLKKAFLDDIITAVTMEEIPPELTLSWDQTGIMFVPCSSWTMEKCGENRVEIGVDDKRQVTAVFVAVWLEVFCLSSYTLGLPFHQAGTLPTLQSTGRQRKPCCST